MSGVNGIGTNSNVKIVDAKDQGFAGLTADDFMKLLIVQLQNQDPTSPMESEQLLAQVSEMRNLQASLQLESALKSLTLGQQISSSASFLGKTVSGNIGNTAISGVVSAVQVREGIAYLKVNGQELEFKDIVTVTE